MSFKKRFVEALLWVPADHLFNLAERVRIERLKKKFGALGENPVIDQHFFVAAPENLFIESNVSFARDVKIMGAGKVYIKTGTIIAPGVTILTTTHDARAVVVRETGYHRNVVIGRNVWIGANATILPGVTIGNNSIVGAGTVVVDDVEEGDVIVGTASRVVRNRISNMNGGKK